MFVKLLLILLLTGLAVGAEELTIDKDNYKGKWCLPSIHQSIVSFRFAVKWKCLPSGRLSVSGTFFSAVFFWYFFLILKRYNRKDFHFQWNMRYAQRILSVFKCFMMMAKRVFQYSNKHGKLKSYSNHKCTSLQLTKWFSSISLKKRKIYDDLLYTLQLKYICFAVYLKEWMNMNGLRVWEGA